MQELQYLSIAGNPFTKMSEIVGIEDMAKSNLQHVDLSNCSLSANFVLNIVEELVKNPALQCLHLTHNAFVDISSVRKKTNRFLKI